MLLSSVLLPERLTAQRSRTPSALIYETLQRFCFGWKLFYLYEIRSFYSILHASFFQVVSLYYFFLYKEKHSVSLCRPSNLLKNQHSVIFFSINHHILFTFSVYTINIASSWYPMLSLLKLFFILFHNAGNLTFPVPLILWIFPKNQKYVWL